MCGVGSEQWHDTATNATTAASSANALSASSSGRTGIVQWHQQQYQPQSQQQQAQHTRQLATCHHCSESGGAGHNKQPCGRPANFAASDSGSNNKPSPATLRRASFLVREPAKLTAEEAVHRSVQPETHNGDVASSAPAAAGAMAAAKQHATIPLHAPEVLAVAFTAHSNGEGAVAQRTEAAATTTPST